MFLLLVVVASLLVGIPLTAKSDTTFKFEQFNGSPLDLFGYASIRSNAIYLTNASQHIFGRAIYPQPVRVKDSNLSFSTTFVFAMLPSYASVAGHGMAFIITSHRNPGGVLSAQFLGLLNMSSIGQPSNHLLAVEFDTVQNEEFQDINDNHVGVDLNDLSSAESHSAGYWTGNDFHELHLNNGESFQAWIDYGHFPQQLNVTIMPAGSPRPQKPLISLSNIDLFDILQEEMYVGFSASTGSVVEDHRVFAWSFATNAAAPVLNMSHIASFEDKNSKSSGSKLRALFVTLLILLTFSVGAAMLFIEMKRKKITDSFSEWEVEFWPHRFSYRELQTATKRFREENLLGRGGFGQVYNGTLPSNGHQVAVKCMFKDSSHGRREFIAEIASLGRLQHRNLVSLRGFCVREKQLFIVYDYMPNGSLDKMVFGNLKRQLGWSQRYIILRDVAAGLLFLHEEWEQKVIHRDVKSSNVLLDAELRGRLGDFGLARLSEHNENPRSSHVVGTLGYIAPELINTGKATAKTDVFSYGVLLLEVVCGREPVDVSKVGNQINLTDWVRQLYANDRLMDAADPKLGGLYVEEEMDRVLKLGLLCSNPRPQARPDMRQVVEILDGKASLSKFLPSLLVCFGPSMNRMSNCSDGHRTYASTSKSQGLDGRFCTISAKRTPGLTL